MICPNCQIDVAISEQLFGALYTCGGCQAVYFINFDGHPEFGEVPTGILSDIISEPSIDSLTAAEPAANPEPVNNSGFHSTFESSFEPLVDSVDMVNFDNKLEAQFESYLGNEGSEPVDEINPFENIQTESVVEPNIHSFSQIAKEISDFGNSEAHVGGLNYDLKITGLDTQITMKQFKEIIEDPRFGWDSNEMLRGVKNGQITIERLNPAKAFVLAKRLQFLDIEKSWKQNALA